MLHIWPARMFWFQQAKTNKGRGGIMKSGNLGKFAMVWFFALILALTVAVFPTQAQTGSAGTGSSPGASGTGSGGSGSSGTSAQPGGGSGSSVTPNSGAGQTGSGIGADPSGSGAGSSAGGAVGSTTAGDNRHDRGSDWGWLGLIGLAGLLGLRKRNEAPARHRDMGREPDMARH
jgi:hypothetical protein